MKLDSFVKSLIPNLKKDSVLEDIRITEDELRNVTIPAYKQADLFAKQWKFSSPAVTARISIFNTLVKKRKGNIIATIYDGVQNCLVNLTEVERMIERSYEDDIIGEGLTYFKANLLQFAEIAQFVSRYSRRFLNYVYAAETACYEGQSSLEEALIPVDIEWIEDNFVNFCQALLIVNREVKDLQQALNNVPEIVITGDNMSTLEASLGIKKIDPLQTGFIPVVLNPCYHIGMLWATWQTNRYHAAKEEIKCLQLRKANLEALSNGKPNAKVQKEIDYIEDKIQNYMKKNAEMERKYA